MGSRASLGYPGAKYETGLEAIEEIEVIAAEIAADVFDASYVEARVAFGMLANPCGAIATLLSGVSTALLARGASDVGGDDQVTSCCCVRVRLLAC